MKKITPTLINGKMPELFKSRALAPLVQWFEKRTDIHIRLVNKFAELIQLALWGDVKYTFPNHDANKYEKPLLIPYIYLSWKYYKPDYKYPEGMEEAVNKASLLHVLSNPHHPEFFDKKNAEINEDNRDAPSGSVIDASSMDENSLIEMISDWAAVGWEKSHSSPRVWFEENKNKRWKFTKQQEELINKAITALEGTGLYDHK